MLKIFGARVEALIDVAENSDFEEEPIENNEEILFVKDSRGIKYTITFKTAYGMCGSGYCGATWGSMAIKPVSSFGPFNFRPKDDGILDGNIQYKDGIYFYESEDEDPNLDEFCEYDINNKYFYYSGNGGDSYYPRGSAGIYFANFEELAERSMKKRPVWVFLGDSGVGKSTLGLYLGRHYSVFETDSVDTLPGEIAADIIIVGNKTKALFEKYGVKEMIRNRVFGDPQIIWVGFEKDEINKED
jgi:hypothetical protein